MVILMNENLLEMTQKLYDLNVTEQLLYKLEYSDINFLKPSISLEEEAVTMKFDTSGLFKSSDIADEPLKERLRFLINIAELQGKQQYLDFSLEPDNLLCDINLIPKVLFRDIANQSGPGFLPMYKALIASFIYPKNSYAEYLSTGEGLYEKQSDLKVVFRMQTVEELKDWLSAKYETEKRVDKEDRIQVNKKRYFFSKKMNIASLFIVVILLALTIYLYFVQIT